ncbi:MAG: hypothetical protein H6651_10775 [Ardenticatenales bacterium]|nr:hypothetical protein [Ardenticatenales bacterium]
MKRVMQIAGMMIGSTLVLAILLTIILFWIVPGQNSLAASSAPDSPVNGPDLDGPSGTPTGEMLGDELPPTNAGIGLDAASALPTPIPGETLLYFTPTDSDATATVLYLTNTDSAAHIVALRGFSYNGVLVYSLNINVGANSFLRLASDSIVAAPPPSWATPAPIITNFTDFTYFASLSLPAGVHAEGYVLFNPGTGTVDPRKDQGAIPLRFTTDPSTLFLPTVPSNP